MPTDPDQDILDLVDQDRRTEALGLLMKRHGKAAYRYVRYKLRDARADDVHSKVFIQAHRDLAKFSRRCTLRAWLFAIARNRVLDELKSPRNQQTTSLDDFDAAADAPPVGDLLDDARLVEALLACLKELREEIREALMLRSLGLSFEEIGELHEARPGTVQARYTRALPVLRACIQQRTSHRV
jgi:RNA polymerase sigma-70 factor (ECF subfamily)